MPKVKCDYCGALVDKKSSRLRAKNFCDKSCWDAHVAKETTADYAKTRDRKTHQIVAEEILGRPLLKGEVVHHIDGNKRNNTESNLMIFSSQAVHVKYHAILNRTKC